MQQSVLMLINNTWREQMPKFKAGDKVRVVSGTRAWYSDRIGQEFTVETCMERLYGDYYTAVGIGGGFYEGDLEFVAPSPKAMLKNGMRVKLRNGNMYTVIDGALIRPVDTKLKLSWISINELGEDLLIDGTNDPALAVMEVYEKPKMVVEYFEYYVPTEVIWKRVEKSDAELRLEQMQAKAAELQNEMAKLQKDIAEGKA